MCSLTASIDVRLTEGSWPCCQHLSWAIVTIPRWAPALCLSLRSAALRLQRGSAKGLASKSNAGAAAGGAPLSFQPPVPAALCPCPLSGAAPTIPLGSQMTPPPGSLGQAPSLGQKEENPNPPQDSCLEKSHEQRNLKGYSPWGCKRVGHDSAWAQRGAGKRVLIAEPARLCPLASGFLQLCVNPADTWHNLPDIGSSTSHVQLQLIIGTEFAFLPDLCYPEFEVQAMALSLSSRVWAGTSHSASLALVSSSA